MDERIGDDGLTDAERSEEARRYGATGGKPLSPERFAQRSRQWLDVTSLAPFPPAFHWTNQQVSKTISR